MLLILTIRRKWRNLSFLNLSFHQFRVNRRSIARIVERVAEAIIEELQDEYLKTPNIVSKWLEIPKNFHSDGTFLTQLVLLMGST